LSPTAEDDTIRTGSLVLYKRRAARVVAAGPKKLAIQVLEEGALSVRPKDVDLLHPGPLDSLDELRPQEGEMEDACELLSGTTTTLQELAELAYGAYTPATAWAAWRWVADGLYVRGTPNEIEIRTPEQVAQEQAERERRAAERQAWTAFLQRTREGRFDVEQDARYLSEVESLALDQVARSRVLNELGRTETPENAHALLLELGYWDHTVVPYPQRLGLSTATPDVRLPELPDEPRVDLTHLPAFAIDDEGSTDPDDAISLERTASARRLWVHVADVAALVPPDSPADLEARARGATLYLPDGKVAMLPGHATQLLGMGLQETSPALSFGLDLDDHDQVVAVEVLPSRVRVKRLTYADVDESLREKPFYELHRIAQRFEASRRENGAIDIDLPEVSVRVIDGKVIIRSLPPLRSRGLVREAMLMAGEAVARFALNEGIPLPYTTQDPPDTDERPDDLAGMFNLRRHMVRSEHSSLPGPHAGLGLARYVQATSPLRRYLDLVVHQQLRAHLRGESLLGTQDLMERIGAAEALAGSASKAERMAIQHWTLVYLLENPGWRGEGIVVERWDGRGKVIIPELGLEPQLQLPQDCTVNSSVPLRLSDVDLPTLGAYFQFDTSHS
jgi:exoribonuclease-2